MKRSESEGEPDQSRVSALIAGVRFELVIAVCALLISTLATAASWWQTQASWQQTRIIDEQLSAQVWPYVGFSEGFPKTDTDEFTIENDGLGPAVIRSVSVLVDGKERSSFVDMLHAILGPNIVRRKAHGESIGLTENAGSSGFVLRPGDSQKMFSSSSRIDGSISERAIVRSSRGAAGRRVRPVIQIRRPSPRAVKIGTTCFT